MPPVATRVPFQSLLILSIVALLAAAVVADGPTNTVNGVTLTNDTDDGSGEQWGRSGGRSLTFTVGNLDHFATLNWGQIAGTSPSVAFDDNVNDPGEVLTLDSSGFANGVARWTGQAFMPMFSGPAILTPTRFTLTITNATGGVAISNSAGGASPGIDVKASGTFTANLLFEGQRVAGMTGGPIGEWVPVLDLYDSEETPTGLPPGEGGPVLTSFSRAFYFTNVPTGMTVEQHDANEIQRFNALSGQVASVKDDTAFLKIETVNRLTGLGTDVGQVKNGINQLLSQGGVQLPPDLARQGDVREVKDELMNLFMILIGLTPCPDPDLCAAVTLLPDVAKQASVDQLRDQVNAVQTTLEELQEAVAVTPKLDLQIVELSEPTTPKRRRWLVRTSVNGSPAAAELAGLHAISSPKQQPAVPSDVTAMATVRQLMPGLMEVVLEVGSPSLADLAFHFTVRHSLGSEVVGAQSLVGDVRR